MVLLTGNHTTEKTPTWVLNPRTGKVTVVSVYSDLERKMRAIMSLASWQRTKLMEEEGVESAFSQVLHGRPGH